MGEAICRINPRIESSARKDFLANAIKLLLVIIFTLPEKALAGRGRKPYDYRLIIVINILRILLRKTYSDYEIEMRRDLRICFLLKLEVLPGKSTIQRGMDNLSMSLLRKINLVLIKEAIQRKLNIMLDASGIRIIGRSIWYSIRIKREISKRECDKVHLAACSDLHLILNWFITNGKKHDSPFFRRLLRPFKLLGKVLADKGYLARVNFQFVFNRKGSAFIPFKSNSTSKPKSHPAWKFAFNLWRSFRTIYESIYHQRSKIEAIFSALKKRFGDELYCKKARMRRKEMALRFIAYNLRIIIYWRYANENNLNLWVRAKKSE